MWNKDLSPGLRLLPEVGVGEAGREGQGITKKESRESRERRELRTKERGSGEALSVKKSLL